MTLPALGNSMGVKTVSLSLAAICTVAIISGCSSDKQSSGPATAANLIPYIVKATRDGSSTSDGSTVDDEGIVHAAPTTANVNGELSSNGDRVWNDGTPFDGLNIVVKGEAFSTGLIGAPPHCHVEVRSKDKLDQVGSTAGADFKATGANTFTAIVPTVHCTDSIIFGWSAPALKAGRSDYEVSIAPVDGSCKPVIFMHPCVVDAALNVRPAPTATPLPQ